MSFDALGLCDELLKNLVEQGYTTPSPIQAKAIPPVLSKRDLMAVAQTGTGKTAAFTLPLLQLMAEGAKPQPKSIRALIVTPTRELAAQVAKSVKTYSQNMHISSSAAFGGVRIEPQIAQLLMGVDVLVATPGRLIDLHNQQALNFDQLEVLVLDEADRMLDLGFVDDIQKIQSLIPNKHQSLMFSATFSAQIKSLAQGMLDNPLLIEVQSVNSTVDSVKQKVHPVDKSRKAELLIHLLKKHQWSQVLVFSRTKQGADNLVLKLEKAGISAASIHANRTQHARTLVLDGFRAGSLKVLVATDIASRGIDINQLPCVINFDLPDVAEDYVHRIGRTGRAGSLGVAISLFSEDQSKQLQTIERLIGKKLPQQVMTKFAPTKKAVLAKSSDDDEYGNFEPDVKPHNKGKAKGHENRNSQATKQNRHKRK
jgi:ATP-dependent RNA helicase RhlE